MKKADCSVLTIAAQLVFYSLEAGTLCLPFELLPFVVQRNNIYPRGNGMTRKKFMVALRGVLVVAAFQCVGVAYALADPTGLWLAKDGAHVSVTSCGAALCATLASTKSPTDPATGAPWTDKHNINPALRSRPLVGVQVLMNMQPSSNDKWSGHLYNTEDGKTYLGNLIEIDARTIRIEGCLGAFCGGDNLTRIK
jgi:uncharacterized protein (DUF2147 family)